MKRILFFLILTSTISVFSQKKKEEQEVNIIRHTVALGETVKMISKKYRVPPSEIYNLNKKAVNGVSGGTVLFIPVPIKSTAVTTIEDDFEGAIDESSCAEVVEKNEVTKILNPEKETELDEIATAVVSKNKAATTEQVVSNQDIVSDYFITHTIKPKETLFSLSREYNVPVAIIKKINVKELKNGLQIGQSIKIPTSDQSNLESENSKEELIVEHVDDNHSENVSDTENKIEFVYHVVLSGETLFGLAKKYNTSVEEINSLNENLSGKGLQVGQTLKIKKQLVF